MDDWAVDLIDAGGYWGIALLMVLENVFPPIPSEVIMGIAGIRVGQGRLEMLPLLLFATIGTTIGNCFWYAVGRSLGLERLRPVVERHGRWVTLRWRDVEALDRMFERHGQKIVFIFRFMPVFRTMVSLPAGIFRMGLLRFLIWTTAGAFIWNVIIANAGYFLGANVASVDRWLGPFANAAVGVMVVAYLWRQLRWNAADKP